MTGTPLSPSFHRAARSALALLQDRLGLEVALLALKDGDDYLVLDVLDASAGVVEGPRGPWTDSLCHVMATRAEPPVAPEVWVRPGYRAVVERVGLPVRAYAGVALRGEAGRLLGSLCASSPTPRGDALLAEQDLLETVGGLLAELLERELDAAAALASAGAALSRGLRDDLTGVLDRRGWQDALQSAEQRCAGTGAPAGVFVVDLDALKPLNDRDGRAAGDALLRRAAAALCDVASDLGAVVPSQDPDGGLPAPAADVAGAVRSTVARTGGDAFAVL
ncbi:MAG: histidine kinase, partial [Frankiales bacterium]|nr:histidine kinase [Frankiales bacterium]